MIRPSWPRGNVRIIQKLLHHLRRVRQERQYPQSILLWKRCCWSFFSYTFVSRDRYMYWCPIHPGYFFVHMSNASFKRSVWTHKDFRRPSLSIMPSAAKVLSNSVTVSRMLPVMLANSWWVSFRTHWGSWPSIADWGAPNFKESLYSK